ncbi:hypothetical protein DEGR_17590 [Deinococcus grandis]|nr:hypothetical protein DEGR_17590 [Deinococcus grandis]
MALYASLMKCPAVTATAIAAAWRVVLRVACIPRHPTPVGGSGRVGCPAGGAAPPLPERSVNVRGWGVSVGGQGALRTLEVQ